MNTNNDEISPRSRPCKPEAFQLSSQGWVCSWAGNQQILKSFIFFLFCPASIPSVGRRSGEQESESAEQAWWIEVFKCISELYISPPPFPTLVKAVLIFNMNKTSPYFTSVRTLLHFSVLYIYNLKQGCKNQNSKQIPPTLANTQKQAPRLQGDALDPAACCLNLLRFSTPTAPGTGHPCPQKKERRGCRKKRMGRGPGRWGGGGEGRESLKWESQRVVDHDGEGAKQKNIVMEKVDGTPSGNRTRVSPVAGEYSTTRPTVY